MWEDVSDDETAFIIERHSEEDDYVNYDTVGANVTHYLDYRVNPNTYYYYRVKSINQEGESAPSNEVRGKTKSLPYSPPRGPSELQGNFNGTTAITLTWEDKSDNEAAFYIYRGETINIVNFLDSLAANSTEYFDYKIESEHRYYYYVAASNSYGISEPTDTIEIQVQDVTKLKSPILSVLKTTNNSIHLMWDSIPGPSVQYQLYRFSNEADKVRFEPNSRTEFTDTELSSNTTFYYQVLVNDSLSNQVWSNVIEARTLPEFVANRISDSLIAMFIFSQRNNELVPDDSWYMDPIEMIISDTISLVENGNEALKISTPNAIISSSQQNNKISEACKLSDEISIECWLKTSEYFYSGVTTVLNFGNDISTAFSLNCQPSSRDINKIVYSVNLSTRTTSQQGSPTLLSEEAVDPNVLNHVVFSHDKSGAERIYINSRLVAEGFRPSGFDKWFDTYTLILANDLSQQNPWLGELYMCSIYNKALDQEEIVSNYLASPFTENNYIP